MSLVVTVVVTRHRRELLGKSLAVIAVIGLSRSTMMPLRPRE